MANNTDYPRKGHYTVVPVADLSNMNSVINTIGDTRKGKEASGKKAGMKVMADNGDGTFGMYIAQGRKPSTRWSLVDGSDTKSPVTIRPETAAFTVGADSVYTDTTGVLTTDGGNDAAGRAFQTVSLPSGKYRMNLEMGGVGTPSNGKFPRVRLNSGTVTAGVGATPLGSAVCPPTFVHATDASLAPKYQATIDLTLGSTTSLTATLDLVTQDGSTLVAGTGYLKITAIEPLTA